jgi:fructuronate reductase
VRRLTSSTLATLPRQVRRPAYDRAGLGIGMAHLGVGAFHRAHQAEFTDDMLEARFGDWGVVGINLRAPRLEPMLGPQDGLFTRTLQEDGAEPRTRAIGCLKTVLDAEADLECSLAALADPRVVVVTMTVTEKGYCHVPATGLPDSAHPDLLHDLAHPQAPRSLPGLLLAALERRRAEKAGPLTLISCDNIPSNGVVLGSAVRALAEQRSADLAAWIADNAAFPSTMVDRIVPATTERDRAAIADALGLDDQGCVVGEPFRQWVIEDRFAGPRPPWDLAGAEFCRDVSGHELIKMRVLNGAQSSFCTLGALIGLDYTFEDARHPVLSRLVRQMLEEETATTLPAVPGMEAAAYIDLSLRRLRNSAIRHTNHQIATDGSQKIVQRLLNPMRDRIRQGRSFDRLACAVAGFIAYLAKASQKLGAPWVPSDPFAQAIRAIADETGPAAAELVRKVLAIEAIFGRDLPQTPGVAAAVTRHVEGLLSPDPENYLRALADRREPRSATADAPR